MPPVVPVPLDLLSGDTTLYWMLALILLFFFFLFLMIRRTVTAFQEGANRGRR